MVCSYLTAPYKSRNVLARAPRGPRLRKHAQLCTLRRKALADCMEALIGSFYVTGGEARFPHLISIGRGVGKHLLGCILRYLLRGFKYRTAWPTFVCTY